MRYQDQRLKYLLWLVLAQTACVAVGAAIHYETTRSVLSPHVDKRLAGELAAPLLCAAGYTLIWSTAMLAIVSYLFVMRIFEEFRKTRNLSEAEALRHVHSLVHQRNAIIFGLAKLAESRDDETGRHLDRMAAYASCLAVAAHSHPRYRNEITKEFVELLRISTPLHDIGKVGIPDRNFAQGRPADAVRAGPDEGTRRHRRQVPLGNRAALGGLEFPADGAGDHFVAPRTMGR